MAIVADSSFSQVSAQTLADHDYTGHIRYLSHETNKNLSVAQIRDLHDHGLGAGVVWETTANRMLQGYPAGAADGQEANDQADARGWPGDRPIYFANDVDLPPQPLPVVAEYIRGVRDRSRREWGIYGEYDLIEAAALAGETTWLWQCAAWSGLGNGSGGSIGGRRVSRYARLFQTVGSQLSGAIDLNVVLADDWGGWYADNRHRKDELDMATMDEVRTVVKEEIRAALGQGVGRSTLAIRTNSKGNKAVYELFLGSGWAKHLGPVGEGGALAVGVPNIGEKGPEVFDRFTPVEGSWDES